MKPEQRLLLALALTLAILTVWSVLVKPPEIQEGRPPQALLPDQGQEILPAPPLPTEEFSLLHLKARVEKKGGGLQLLQVEGSLLLMESNPGFLRVDLLEPPLSLPEMETVLQGQTLLSRAQLGEGLLFTRKISSAGKDINSLYNIELCIKNETDQAQLVKLQCVLYRPLYASQMTERGYLEGRAKLEGKVQRLQLPSGESRRFREAPAWVSSQSKSHTLIVKGLQPEAMFHVEHRAGSGPTGWLELKENLPPSGEKRWRFQLYAGPITLATLREAGLEETISFGAFSGIAKLLLITLTWSQSWLHNYGLAILFLSLGIWLLFFPLTWSGIRMMRVMGELQPQIERLRKEHGKNPERMNREMLQLYRKYRVNPLSGCLPLLLQMPIFIALYQVLTRSVELQGAHFLWIQDLSAPDALVRFPSEVPLLGKSLNLLPILMVIAMLLQQRLTKRFQVALTEEQRIQQKIFGWFPVLFGFMFYSLPSGLVLYWVANTLLTTGQQLLLLRVHGE